MNHHLVIAIAAAAVLLPGVLGGRFLKGEHAARILQATNSAQGHRLALEALLKREAAAIEDSYNALVHAGETVDMCYVTSVCAPRGEFTLSRVDMYQPKNCKPDGSSTYDAWTLSQEQCPVNNAVTRAMYDLDLESPSAIYPKQQGVPNQANWRNVALQTPPSQDRVKKVMCATNPLDGLWKQQYDTVPNTFWQYYGDQSTGIWKFYPGGGDTCSEYDPRMRPWYSSAATGPKDVVIVIDQSGSMTRSSRLQKAKDAASAVIDTLNGADFATVISFGTGSTSFSEPKGGVLVRADEQTRKDMKAFVARITAYGKTNYEQAFKTAFDVVDNSRAKGETSGCHTNTILFLTDGEITVGKEGNEFLDYVRSLNHADVDTRVFSYAFGDDVVNNKEASRVLKAVADQNKGVAFRVGDAGDGSALKTIMSQYYVYWASGIASTQPRWSEIYTDFGTGLDCLTGALPVYDRTVDPPVLFGVVGIDVAPNDDGFAEYPDYGATLATMQEETRLCAEVHFTDSQIADLRRKLSPAVYPSSSSSAPAAAAAAAAAAMEAAEEEDDDVEKCSDDNFTSKEACEAAGETWGTSGGGPTVVIIIAAVVAVGLVAFAAFHFGRHSARCKSPEKQPAPAAARPQARHHQPPVAPGMYFPHGEDSVERIRSDAPGRGNVYYPTALPAGRQPASPHGRSAARRAPMAVPTAPPAPPGAGRNMHANSSSVTYM